MTQPIMLQNKELVELLKRHLNRQGDHRLVVTFQLGAINMQSQDGLIAPTAMATVIAVGIEPVSLAARTPVTLTGQPSVRM